MSERLSDVEARLHSVRQLSAVITAMRGIAAARAREARGRLDGIRAYSSVIAGAIGQALALQTPPPAAPAGKSRGAHAIVALCAEQGFAGAFSDRVLAAAERAAAAARAPARYLVVGGRGLALAEERGLAVDWSAPMVAHAGLAATLANHIVEALYDRLESEDVTRVTLIYSAPDASTPPPIVERRLAPFDFARFAAAPSGVPPILTLPPATLLARLVEEYVFAELCEAVTLSFAAENEARMRAMIAARDNVEETLGGLVALSRRLRQEEITNEIVELASGAAPRGGGAERRSVGQFGRR